MRQVNLSKIIALVGVAGLFGLAISFFPSFVFLGAALFALATLFYLYPRPSFYALVGYLPFQLALNISSDIDLLSGRVLILILAAACLINFLKEKNRFNFKSQPAVALVLFFLIALLSVFVAANQGWALRKALVFLSVFPLFFLTEFFIKNTEQLKKILWIMVGVATSVSIVALVQFVSQFVWSANAVFNFWAQKIVPLFVGKSFGQAVVQNPSWFVEINSQPLMRAIGFFPDPHMLAFFLGLTSPLVLVLAFGGKKHRLLLFTVYCLLFTVMLLTFSRGGYLGIAFSFLVMAAVTWQWLAKRTKVFLASAFLILAVLVFFTPVGGRFFSSFNLAEGSNLGRLEIWNQSLWRAENNLLLGVGLGNYPLALNFNESYRSAVTSHNLYLDILVELGIFGLLAWLWFLGSAVKILLVKIKQDFGCGRILAVGFLGSLTYFFIHSFFETAIFNPTILAFLMIVAGLTLTLGQMKINRRTF